MGRSPVKPSRSENVQSLRIPQVIFPVVGAEPPRRAPANVSVDPGERPLTANPWDVGHGDGSGRVHRPRHREAVLEEPVADDQPVPHPQVLGELTVDDPARAPDA